MISGVNVQFGRFAASPIFAAAYRGLEGLLLCETDFDDGWGAPGNSYVQTPFDPHAGVFVVREPVEGPAMRDAAITAQRLERCRHNNLPV